MLTRPNPMPKRVMFTCVGLVISFVLIVASGAYRFKLRISNGMVVEVHRPIDRAATLERIADSIIPENMQVAWSAPCVELSNVKRAFDERLATLSSPSASGPAILAGRYVIAFSRYRSVDEGNCRSVAREVDAEINRSWRMFLVPESWRERSANKSSRIWGERSWRPNLKDIETRNAWAIVPGCIRGVDGQAIGGICNGSAARGLEAVIGDPMLVDGIVSRLSDASQTFSGRTTEFHGRQIPVGHDVTLGIDPGLQSRAGALVRCFTGETASCAGILPSHLANDWHYQAGNLRAGAAGVVIIRVRTGEVVAAAGSVSDCSKSNLLRKAEVISVAGRDRMPVFRGNELCAQLPDSVGAQTYASVDPIFFNLGPGSTMKTLAILAGIEFGVVPASQDAFYRVLLARSRDPDGKQRIPQRIARQSAPQFQKLLGDVGFDARGTDVLFGDFGGAGVTGWKVPIRSGFVKEEFSADEQRFGQIQAAKTAGQNADAMFGRDAVANYLKAYRLGITAIGSGEIRHSAFGLADWSRRLVLRAQGADHMVSTHMASIQGLSPPPVDLRFARPESVRRLFGMLNGATSSLLGGTAAGSCRVAFGSCPAAGEPAIVFAKTGTSEATDGGEAGSYFKVGGSGTAPAKVFMAAWVGSDGELYSGGAMTLRIREDHRSAKPELHSSSAAELLFLTVLTQIKRSR